MTVTLELRPEEVTALQRRADAEGVGIETILHRLIAQIAPSPVLEAKGEWETNEKQKGAIPLMQAWRQEEETDDPEELAERDREMEEVKANLDRWRAEAGRPSAF